MSYSVINYVAMIGDPNRTGAYVRALRRMVTPDSVVLDLGAGFGFFAVLAAKLGARHVYAIEPNEAISLGRALARANGVSDRVTFYHGDARHVTLPERANLLLEDMRGVMPLHAERIAVLRDARERLLTSDARRVALRDTLWAAPARHPAAVSRDFATVGADTYGVDLRALRAQVVDGRFQTKVKADDLLLPGAALGSLELGVVSEPNFEGTARWTLEAPLVVDGFAVWFDAELSEGERFSAAPGAEQTVHGCLYLPLREPITLVAGDGLSFRFCATQASGDYSWTWECAVTGGDGGHRRTPRQSTLGAQVATRARVLARSELHTPALGLEGRRWREAVALMDGVRPSREIAAGLAAAPGCGFATEPEAFDWLQRALLVLESGAVEEL